MFYNIKEPILITGPAGFIGSNLLRKCVDEKLNVNVFLRKSSNTWRIEDILDKVWGNEVVVGGRTIDVHIRKLREKIGDKKFKTITLIFFQFFKNYGFLF